MFFLSYSFIIKLYLSIIIAAVNIYTNNIETDPVETVREHARSSKSTCLFMTITLLSVSSDFRLRPQLYMYTVTPTTAADKRHIVRYLVICPFLTSDSIC